MAQTSSLVPVSFHGDTIFAVEHDGQPYAPVRPIVENMGLDWKTQHRKLRSNKERFSVVIMTTVAGDAKNRETVCIPVRKLAGFLATITPRKCRADLREKILAYQAECDDALWNYWHHGRAENPRAGRTEKKQPEQKPLTMNEAFLELRRDAAGAMAMIIQRAKRAGREPGFLEKIVRYRKMGLTQTETARLVNCDRTALVKYESMLKKCGYDLKQEYAKQAKANKEVSVWEA